ncbi:hypothetical protein A2Y83_04585 [Candidatus Falkowbacteria bacterium RBG_13_39_14]|uniref:GIY-YIG domain-containing protein n=1 Tax=Candidatus Falkowbacteria bacterium RBG_13_39_14 TaxID=1797985 RepID=A0A1F5S6R8_9BACT|nr:MAG: hypothetical protein A2Y83_04585 [Candidatus Falkowbacteria bacterium RBG_13_39_14]
MCYVYIIKFIYGKIYIGSTSDLKRRLQAHQKRGDFELVYYEAYKAESDARRREHNLKYFGKAYGQLKGRIKESVELCSKGAG